VSAPAGRRCADCGSPLAGDQRYCLQCGARTGEPEQALQELVAAARESWPEAAAPEPEPAAPASAPGPRMPPSGVSALLLAAFLGFGVLLGSAAGNPPQDASAGLRGPLRLVVPGSSSEHAEAAPGAITGTGSEPPAAVEQATPAPAKSAPVAPKTTTAASEGTSSEGEQGSPEGSTPGAATKLPPIHHVWVVVLSDEPYATSFGPSSSAKYLTQTLEHQGELLVRYHAIAHEELANLVALVSGQGPTPQTQANCPTYVDLAPATPAAGGQLLGEGCVYPASTRTLPGELSARHLSWRAYVQGSGEGGASAALCAHPALGAADPSAAQASSTGPYATFRDPFAYFAAFAGAPGCGGQVAGLSRLGADLARGKAAPSLSYVIPDRCEDGNPTPCTAGAAAGMGPADHFLSTVIPQIEHSSAYHHGGLIVLTSDEAPSSGEYGDSGSCCGQPASYPDIPAGSSPFSGTGGGTVGALLLSPYVKGGTTSQEQANHFSLLRTIEDLLKVGHVGYSALPAVKDLEPSLFLAKPSG
jgi:hypothetical protein